MDRAFIRRWKLKVKTYLQERHSITQESLKTLNEDEVFDLVIKNPPVGFI